MSRPLQVPDLVIGADAGHFGLVPIDVARAQQPQTETGIGRTFVNAQPYAGLAILSPFKPRQVINPDAAGMLPGLTSGVPFAIGEST